MNHDASESTSIPIHRLSIAYLLCLTAGIGVAISIARGIERLRFPADQWYYGQREISELDARGFMVAALYGLAVSTFVFAWRSGQLWDSPGKVLAFLFAAMCILNWSLEAIAAVSVWYQVRMDPPGLEAPDGYNDPRAYVLGIWYRNFAPSIGYVISLPLLALVIFKTRKQTKAWRAVWIAFAGFSAMLIAKMYWSVPSFLPPHVRVWYFELAIGLPVFFVAIALVDSWIRKVRVDWWTTVLAVPLLCMWLAGVAIKLVTV